MHCQHVECSWAKHVPEYHIAFGHLLEIMAHYIEKRSRSVGSKTARQFIRQFPGLINDELIDFLTAIGTNMLLSGDERTRLVIQTLAEVIGQMEPNVCGRSNTRQPLKMKKYSQGYKQATNSALLLFYKERITCCCLDDMHLAMQEEKQEHDDDDFGFCCFDQCGARKTFQALAVCSGCKTACYCCVECQRKDWKNHSTACKLLQKRRHRRPKETTGHDDVTDKTGDETERTCEFLIREVPSEKTASILCQA